jgi:hypothetical protein
MGAWHSPQSVFSLGHRAVKDIFTVPVQVQEKIDGSFFAFGLFPEITYMPDMVGSVECMELKIRSKGAVMIPDAPEALFKLAAKAVKDREHMLHPNWQYRGETLAKPKHNTLSYDRTPIDNIILFDVLTDEETYLPYEELYAEGKRLGLEVVPQLFVGNVENAEQLRVYLNTTSVLGGQKIEGVVIKPIQPIFGQDKKALFGKFVSEQFKEAHRASWGESNPGPKDIIQRLGGAYANPARFQKALIHLREAGKIEGSPRDIGMLVKEIPVDILKEHEQEIKDALFKYAWPHIARIAIREVPGWYKDLLLRAQFEQDENATLRAEQPSED